MYDVAGDWVNLALALTRHILSLFRPEERQNHLFPVVFRSAGKSLVFAVLPDFGLDDVAEHGRRHDQRAPSNLYDFAGAILLLRHCVQAGRLGSLIGDQGKRVREAAAPARRTLRRRAIAQSRSRQALHASCRRRRLQHRECRRSAQWPRDRGGLAPSIHAIASAHFQLLWQAKHRILSGGQWDLPERLCWNGITDLDATKR
mmetsp:Transcript_48603/g.90116  ORF Transcript_48603/g.90116 Transcript_48603/m.90116 type:complete len:202 (+) Transcript_48603:916-1521(+)